VRGEFSRQEIDVVNQIQCLNKNTNKGEFPRRAKFSATRDLGIKPVQKDWEIEPKPAWRTIHGTKGTAPAALPIGALRSYALAIFRGLGA
jgi:hypothetical protein